MSQIFIHSLDTNWHTLVNEITTAASDFVLF